jgi:hypothetical protein
MFEQYAEGDDVEFQNEDGRWVVGKVTHHVRNSYTREVVGLSITFSPLGLCGVVTLEAHRVRPLQLQRWAHRLGQGTYDPIVGRIDWGKDNVYATDPGRVDQGKLALAGPAQQGFTMSEWVKTAVGPVHVRHFGPDQSPDSQEKAMEELKRCPPGKATTAKRDDHPPGIFTVPKRTIETPLGTFTEGDPVEVWANDKLGWLTGRMTVLSGQHRDKQPNVYVNLDEGQLVMFGTDHRLVSVRAEAKYVRRVGLACVCGGRAAKSTCYHWCDAYVAP